MISIFVINELIFSCIIVKFNILVVYYIVWFIDVWSVFVIINRK